MTGGEGGDRFMLGGGDKEKGKEREEEDKERTREEREVGGLCGCVSDGH